MHPYASTVTISYILIIPLQYVRASGTIVPVGLPLRGRLNADLLDIATRRVKIRGSEVANVDDTEEALQVFHEKKLQIPCQVVDVEELPLVHKLMEEGKIVSTSNQKRTFLLINMFLTQMNRSIVSFLRSPRNPQVFCENTLLLSP
jgi:D-arabinose 1-dehydrogenase-like Zn-dependent alcohol dehydrogenase